MDNVPSPNEVNDCELGHEVNSEIGSQSHVSDKDKDHFK